MEVNGLETKNVEAPRLALRPAEAAKAIGIGRRLLWELTNKGDIPSVKLGRCTVYPVAALEGYLADQAKKTRQRP